MQDLHSKSGSACIGCKMPVARTCWQMHAATRCKDPRYSTNEMSRIEELHVIAVGVSLSIADRFSVLYCHLPKPKETILEKFNRLKSIVGSPMETAVGAHRMAVCCGHTKGICCGHTKGMSAVGTPMVK